MPSLSLYLGADHAGFALKEKIKAALLKQGYAVQDLSPMFQDGDDYPAHAVRVGKKIASQSSARGILVCGSGIGMAIAANRLKGVRALEGHDAEEIRIARQDNDANILSLSGRRLSPANALKLIRVFLETAPSKALRHRRRIQQLG